MSTDSNVIENVGNDFAELLNTLSNLKSSMVIMASSIKLLEKKVKKEMKVLEKEANKNKNKGNRKPTGFASQGPISKELCEFMKVENGTEFARTEVTKYIIQYIKDKNLQDVKNKKIIKPDKALHSLLQPENEEVTYFNLQKHMNKHFVKKKDQ